VVAKLLLEMQMFGRKFQVLEVLMALYHRPLLGLMIATVMVITKEEAYRFKAILVNLLRIVEFQVLRTRAIATIHLVYHHTTINNNIIITHKCQI